MPLEFLGSRPDGFKEWQCRTCEAVFTIRFEGDEGEPNDGDPQHCPECGDCA